MKKNSKYRTGRGSFDHLENKLMARCVASWRVPLSYKMHKYDANKAFFCFFNYTHDFLNHQIWMMISNKAGIFCRTVYHWPGLVFSESLV